MYICAHKQMGDGMGGERLEGEVRGKGEGREGGRRDEKGGE